MLTQELLNILQKMDFEDYISSDKSIYDIKEIVEIELKKHNIYCSISLSDLKSYILEMYEYTIIDSSERMYTFKYWVSIHENENSYIEENPQSSEASHADGPTGFVVPLQVSKKKLDPKDKGSVTNPDLPGKHNPSSIPIINNAPFEPKSLAEVGQAIGTLLKNINELKAEIRAIKTILVHDKSNKSTNVKENREFIEQIMRIYTSQLSTRQISINKELEKSIEDLVHEKYGIKDDYQQVINIALLLALLKGRT